MGKGHLVRNIITFAVVLGAAVFLIGRTTIVREETPSPPTQTEGEAAEKPTRRIELVGHSTVSKRNAAGESVWEARIDGDWRLDEATAKILGSKVSWRAVGEDLQPLQVTAGRFEADDASDMVRFADDVEAMMPSENARFTAEELQYDVSQQRIAAAGDVVLRWGNMLVTGQRLTADMVAHKIWVRGKARMTYEG